MRGMAPFDAHDGSSNNDDVGPSLYTISVLFTVIASITTALRLWVRRKRQTLGGH